MKELFFLVEEAAEGGYTAKALGESIFTEADSIEDLKIEIKDAVFCHFEENDLPKIIRLHMVKEETLIL
ncbi:2-oxoisovalerate dehydrogenase [Rubrolithibacter danxiaensis]|uniref:2-oxoisovalerate dehydrogenase n=1 Tax=Rubrolithibacter danxiaensis TaxID=3390805 RepID=UPI003BF8367F